ncbi:MAG TPA: alpha/beta hydrolase [Stellaceae bacterium]|nr:alpha/beta hydrolase [Stellaceae bacterium]
MGQQISFLSCGETIRGVLELPKGATGKVPLAIMAGGWCYVKEIVMPYYAKPLVEAGVGVLMFDYRNLGESDGVRRQHIDPWAQIEDYKNAISFAETLEAVDPERIGVWGISYSGGHVLVVGATDPRVRFIIGTVPVVDGYATLRRCHGETRFAELKKLLLADRRKRSAGEPGDTMPMSSLHPFEEMSTWPYPHVKKIFEDIKAREAPRHEHYNTIESTELLLNYNVAPYATRIYDTPVVIAIAKGDNITSSDLETDIYNLIPNPNKHLAIIEGVTHMSLYSNEDHLAKVGRVHADWVKRTLGL